MKKVTARSELKLSLKKITFKLCGYNNYHKRLFYSTFGGRPKGISEGINGTTNKIK